MTADAWLAGVLNAGPRQSREVRGLADLEGISEKALRGARLRLGLTVTRAGNGRNMRSTWALPSSRNIAAPSCAPVVRNAATTKRARETPASTIKSMDDATRGAANLTADELTRIERRAAAFVARRGLSMVVAKEVATRLVLERDRLESRAGSCVECQNFRGPGSCATVTRGTPEVARPVSEIWMCWLARRDL